MFTLNLGFKNKRLISYLRIRICNATDNPIRRIFLICANQDNISYALGILSILHIKNILGYSKRSLESISIQDSLFYNPTFV